jgi:hypothetical protein
MISIEHRTTIAASTDEVWRWFRALDTNYRAWHPEHLTWRTLRGDPLSDGAVVFADEWIGAMRLSARLFISGVEPGHYFSYRIGLPASLVRAGGSFRLAATSDRQCALIEEVHLGSRTPAVGCLLDHLLSRLLPMDDLRRHMREEGERLAQLFSSDGTI